MSNLHSSHASNPQQLEALAWQCLRQSCEDVATQSKEPYNFDRTRVCLTLLEKMEAQTEVLLLRGADPAKVTAARTQMECAHEAIQRQYFDHHIRLPAYHELRELSVRAKTASLEIGETASQTGRQGADVSTIIKTLQLLHGQLRAERRTAKASLTDNSPVGSQPATCMALASYIMARVEGDLQRLGAAVELSSQDRLDQIAESLAAIRQNFGQDNATPDAEDQDLKQLTETMTSLRKLNHTLSVLASEEGTTIGSEVASMRGKVRRAAWDVKEKWLKQGPGVHESLLEIRKALATEMAEWGKRREQSDLTLDDCQNHQTELERLLGFNACWLSEGKPGGQNDEDDVFTNESVLDSDLNELFARLIRDRLNAQLLDLKAAKASISEGTMGTVPMATHFMWDTFTDQQKNALRLIHHSVHESNPDLVPSFARMPMPPSADGQVEISAANSEGASPSP